jgi:hypothetical protein
MRCQGPEGLTGIICIKTLNGSSNLFISLLPYLLMVTIRVSVCIFPILSRHRMRQAKCIKYDPRRASQSRFIYNSAKINQSVFIDPSCLACSFIMKLCSFIVSYNLRKALSRMESGLMYFS